MTREEQIKSEADYSYGGNYKILQQQCFIEGAKWADKTMIDKVCEWLDKVNTDNYMDSGIFQMSALIIDLKKEMEE